MNRLTRLNSLATAALFGVLALALAPQAQAQEPADLAPADTAFFMHIDDPDAWFTALTQGPLGEKMRKQIETAEGSGDMLAALNMNIDQFMGAFFGEDLVVISPGEGKDGVMFTKVNQANRNLAIDTFQLKENGEVAGYPLYVGPEGDGYFVMMKDWVAMCDINAVEYLTSVLDQAPGAKTLKNTEHYIRWERELPANRAMSMFAFESKESQHAIGVVRNGVSLDATYLGISPDADELMSILGKTEVAEFGPVPADAIGAMTFNIVANDEIKQGLQGLNMMLGGKSFVDDVLPKLDAPTVMFLGSVPGDAVDPTVGVEVPVHGLAMKMKDASVAQDLDTLFNNAVLLANVAVTQMPADQIPQRTGTYKGSSFKVAELGTPIAKALDFPELGPIQLVYGQIGDYYVFCTQEEFFKKCVDANAGGEAMRIDVEGPAHRLAKMPVLAMTGRPDGLGKLLLSWGKMLEDKGLPEAIPQDPNNPMDLEGLFDVIQVLQQYSLIKMQIWSGEDDVVVGRAQLTAPL